MNTNFGEKKPMKDDPLKILRYVASDFFQFQLVKIALSIILLVHVSTVFAALYYILFVFEDTKTKVVSFAFALGEFYPMLALITLLYKNKLVSEMHEEIRLWSIDNAGSEVRSRIKRHAKVLTIFISVTMCIGLCGSVLVFPNLEHDIEWFIVIRIIQDYCPDHFQLLAFLYKLTLASYGYVLNVHPFQVIYYTQHCRYQIMMFKEILENLGDFHAKINEKELFHNSDYQREVERRLKFCIVRGQQVIDGQKKKIDEIGNLIAGFSICGWLWGICIIIIIFSGVFSSAYYPLISFMALGTVLSFNGLIVAGQSVITEVEEMAFTLNNIKWYNFNQTNKILYNVMTIHLSKPRKIKFSENLSINYELGLRILRGVYSVMMVFRKVN